MHEVIIHRERAIKKSVFAFALGFLALLSILSMSALRWVPYDYFIFADKLILPAAASLPFIATLSIIFFHDYCRAAANAIRIDEAISIEYRGREFVAASISLRKTSLGRPYLSIRISGESDIFVPAYMIDEEDRIKLGL